MEPGYADGWVNVGARAAPGRQHAGGRSRCCDRRSTIDPELAKTHFFLGTALEEPTAATTRRSRTCARPPRKYPRDRVVLNQLGRVLFLKRQYAEAIDEFSSVLAIDPEDLQAHYNLMLVLPGPGRHASRPRASETLYRALQGRRVGAGDHRAVSPAPSATTTTSGSRSTSIGTAVARRRPRCTRARYSDDGMSAARGALAPRRDRAGDRRRVRASRPPRRRRAADVHRRHRRGRHPLHAQQRRVRQEVPARDDGLGRRVPRRRRRRLAGHPARQLDELAGPAGAPIARRRSTATTRTARSPTSPRGAGLARRAVRPGRRRRRLRQRRPRPTSTSPRSGANRLFHNVGGGKFADVTDDGRRRRPGFSTSAAWFDYDRDGRLDLFVAQLRRSGRSRRTCSARSTARRKSYCTPESYKGQSSTLYRNRGDGTFEDVTQRGRACTIPTAKALGVALLDYDSDGWLDLFVANDTQPNRLYRNKRQRHVHRRRR